MALDPRLEHYLSSLDRALSAVPVSDRADIVTEIKSHVLSALEREPKPALDSVLQALGEPEIVANHYLMERGLKTGKPPVSPVVKWIVVGFLGTLALMVVLVGLVLHAMGPIVKISDKEDRVTLLGGFIDIDGKKGTFKIGDSYIDGGKESGHIDGSLPSKAGERVTVKFTNGKVTAETAEEDRFSWECRGRRGEKEPVPTPDNAKGLTLDLSDVHDIACTLHFPKGSDAHVAGNNGKIVLSEPRFNFEAALDNGRANVQPADGVKYAYDFSVRNGKTESRASDPNPDYRLHVQIGNGKISVEGKE